MKRLKDINSQVTRNIQETTERQGNNERGGKGLIKHQIQEVISKNAGHLSGGSKHNLECNLHALGKYLKDHFPNLQLSGLGKRHIDSYVDHLKQNGIVVRSIINTISHLRFLAKGIDKANIVFRTNAEYGFERIARGGFTNRAVALSPGQLESLGARHHSFQTAAEMQRLFGLRLEEAGRFIAWQADRGGYLALAGSWCKGGRPRNVPLNKPEQRQFIEMLKRFKGKGESVAGKDFEKIVAWKRAYHDAMKSIGTKSHSIRHATIQQWYREGTGYEPPICGGPRIKEMPQEVRETVRAFLFQLAESIGHGRIDVLNFYLGKM